MIHDCTYQRGERLEGKILRCGQWGAPDMENRCLHDFLLLSKNEGKNTRVSLLAFPALTPEYIAASWLHASGLFTTVPDLPAQKWSFGTTFCGIIASFLQTKYSRFRTRRQTTSNAIGEGKD